MNKTPHTLTYHNLGSSIAFKIKANSKQEVEQAHNLYYNHDATNGRVIWIDEVTFTEAYFLSDFKRMLKGLKSIWFHRLCNDPIYKRHKYGVIKDGSERAFKELYSIEEEYFYKANSIDDDNYHEIGPPHFEETA